MNDITLNERPLRQELSPKNMLSRGIPKHFLDVSMDDFKTFDDPLLEVAKDFVARYISRIDLTRVTGDGIFFYGSNGTGKTMLSSIIIKEAYRHRFSSKRITFMEYINEYTKIWKARTVDEKENMEDYFYSFVKAVDFLVLEEVGKEQSNRDISVSILEDCLRYREEHGLCTIICANMYLEDLIKRYESTSIESLIKGNTRPVKLIGIDRRSTKNSK